jgi:hypothetical protein
VGKGLIKAKGLTEMKINMKKNATARHDPPYTQLLLLCRDACAVEERLLPSPCVRGPSHMRHGPSLQLHLGGNVV